MPKKIVRVHLLRRAEAETKQRINVEPTYWRECTEELAPAELTHAKKRVRERKRRFGKVGGLSTPTPPLETRAVIRDNHLVIVGVILNVLSA